MTINLILRMKTDKTETPSRRRGKDVLSTPKQDPALVRGLKTRTTSKTPKEPKGSPTTKSSPKNPKTSPRTKKSNEAKKVPAGKNDILESHASTPPKPNVGSKLKLSVSSSQISLADDTPLSALESLNNSSGSDPSTDTLDKLSEIGSDELADPVPLIQIPDNIRAEAGTNWRLKEAILNSFHFGIPTIKSHEFARSDSDLKTAEILSSNEHTLDSKKYRVKMHLGILLSIILLTESFNRIL